jgi:lysine/ornithine N-monooxygenase
MSPGTEGGSGDSLAEAFLNLLQTSPKAQKVVRDIMREDPSGGIPT